MRFLEIKKANSNSRERERIRENIKSKDRLKGIPKLFLRIHFSKVRMMIFGQHEIVPLDGSWRRASGSGSLDGKASCTVALVWAESLIWRFFSFLNIENRQFKAEIPKRMGVSKLTVVDKEEKKFQADNHRQFYIKSDQRFRTSHQQDFRHQAHVQWIKVITSENKPRSFLTVKCYWI